MEISHVFVETVFRGEARRTEFTLFGFVFSLLFIWIRRIFVFGVIHRIIRFSLAMLRLFSVIFDFHRIHVSLETLVVFSLRAF
jgi:hypothetical protein